MKFDKLSIRIPLEGTINTRDLGGYKTKDGRQIKYKRIIRTDKLCNVTDNDIKFLIENYNPKFDIDLRAEGEVKRHPDRAIPGCKYVINTFGSSKGKPEFPHEEYNTGDSDIDHLINFLYTLNEDASALKGMEGSYASYITSEAAKESISSFFRILINNKEGSIFYHCSDGKDRAGTMTMLFLLALGVDKEAIVYDYLKTNEYTKGKRDYRDHYLNEVVKLPNKTLVESILMVAGVRENWLNAAYQKVMEFGGIETYLTKNIGLTEEELNELKDNYLE